MSFPVTGTLKPTQSFFVQVLYTSISTTFEEVILYILDDILNLPFALRVLFSAEGYFKTTLCGKGLEARSHQKIT